MIKWRSSLLGVFIILGAIGFSFAMYFLTNYGTHWLLGSSVVLLVLGCYWMGYLTGMGKPIPFKWLKDGRYKKEYQKLSCLSFFDQDAGKFLPLLIVSDVPEKVEVMNSGMFCKETKVISPKTKVLIT